MVDLGACVRYVHWSADARNAMETAVGRGFFPPREQDHGDVELFSFVRCARLLLSYLKFDLEDT